MAHLLTFAGSLPARTILAVVVLSSFAIYKRLNSTSAPGDVLMTRLDHSIPFIPAFSVPYLIYIPYLFFVICYGIILTPFYAEVAMSALVVQVAAAIVYGMHGTTVPRPEVNGTDVFSRLARFVYSSDRPHCAFPSLHVAYALLCGYWTLVFFPSLLPLIVLLTVAIILSTLFLKQHALIDVIGGTSLACLALVFFS